MRILFLHGWHSVPGGVKPTYLKEAGHEVINSKLDDDDFEAAVRSAQSDYDQHHPDVIVGSSRGGAVAMNIDSGDTPLVLLCPAWKNWGTVKTLKPNSMILHSRQDEVIAFGDSEELVASSGLSPETLIEAGDDHRLIARIGKDAYDAALQNEHVGEFDITGKPMKGWVMVEPDGIDSDHQLTHWIDQAALFVRTLPGK